jgi:thiamine biosynthesis lipoprotein
MRGGAIDLGGIAKGWLADRLAERLGANVLVNFCGDLYARGGGESGEGWPVGFGDKTLLLKDLGAATSGTRKRAWPGGHHLIDPRTGRPAESDLSEVSVLASTATDAEIYAKVALLLGSRDAPTWLEPRSPGWSLA